MTRSRPVAARRIQRGHAVAMPDGVRVVTQAGTRVISTRVGGARRMRAMELDDETRFDAPLDHDVDVTNMGEVE